MSQAIQTKHLELVQFCIRNELSRLEMADSVSQESYVSWYTNNIVTELRTSIWCESEQTETHEIKHPSNWWDAFKERWFPDWALTRWPVGYTVHVIAVHTRIGYPDHKHLGTAMKYGRLEVIA